MSSLFDLPWQNFKIKYETKDNVYATLDIKSLLFQMLPNVQDTVLLELNSNLIHNFIFNKLLLFEKEFGLNEFTNKIRDRTIFLTKNDVNYFRLDYTTLDDKAERGIQLDLFNLRLITESEINQNTDALRQFLRYKTALIPTEAKLTELKYKDLFDKAADLTTASVEPDVWAAKFKDFNEGVLRMNKNVVVVKDPKFLPENQKLFVHFHRQTSENDFKQKYLKLESFLQTLEKADSDRIQKLCNAISYLEVLDLQNVWLKYQIV
jgi:hypothetical protein